MIDPVCLFHGLKRSEHYCLYCCLCFDMLADTQGNLYEDKIYVDEEGVKHDVCKDCKKREDEYGDKQS